MLKRSTKRCGLCRKDSEGLIELVALEGRSYEEVAKCHGLALGTVKSRISRGRTQLRQALEGRTAANEPRLHERKLAA